MFGSSVLEIIIGLVFVYFIMSLLCSALNEWIARIFAMRTKTLQEGIMRLLSDNENLKKEIYNHPLVKGLYGKSSRGPSNLPARRFALALSDILMNVGYAKRKKEGKLTSIAIAEDRDIDDKGKSKELQIEAKEMLKNLEKGIAVHIKSGELQQALQGILKSAKAEVDQWDAAVTSFRVSIENWFDDTMDRVSGWYKRKTQLIILSLAIIVSFGFNLDTFAIANTLSQDTTLRASVVAAAEAQAQQPIPEGTEPALDVSELRDELSGLGLPIGWSEQDGEPGNVPQGLGEWIVKIFGILITALAVVLGAPFWFDLLNKLVNLRSGGKQPARVMEGGSSISRSKKSD